MLFKFVRFTSKMIFKFFFGLRILGMENIPARGGFILASNHVSFLDPVVCGAACPREINFMARHDLFKNRFFGWFIRKLHAFPVKRQTGDIYAIKESLRRLQQNQGLLVFPEGSRQEAGLSETAQSGIGFLASKSQVPIIPAYIHGTAQALPKGAKFFHQSRISIMFGKQIPIERRLSYHDIAQRALDGIRQLSCSISS